MHYRCARLASAGRTRANQAHAKSVTTALSGKILASRSLAVHAHLPHDRMIRPRRRLCAEAVRPSSRLILQESCCQRRRLGRPNRRPPEADGRRLDARASRCERPRRKPDGGSTVAVADPLTAFGVAEEKAARELIALGFHLRLHACARRSGRAAAVDGQIRRSLLRSSAEKPASESHSWPARRRSAAPSSRDRAGPAPCSPNRAARG